MISLKRDKQRTYERKLETLSCSYCCSGKAVSIVCCVSTALFIQDATRMRRIVLPSVACPAVPNFPHYPTNGRIL
jgi:hypothetical protein